jgi:lysophospholipase L1-like esterase
MTGPRSGPIRVVFFGDSICVGQGVSIHQGWVTRLAARIEDISRDKDREILVVNASANGNTTRQALERMPYEVQSQGVDYLLVQFGLNDCNHWQTDRGLPRVSLRAFEANLDEILERAFRFGARRAILNTNHPTVRTKTPMLETSLTYEDSNRAYNEAIRTVAGRWADRVDLNDVECHIRALANRGEVRIGDLLQPDGLHLSVRGHEVYFSLVCPLLERLLV